MDSTIIASFLSSLLVGIFAFVGVKLQTKANEKNISKQVEEGLKANIELLNKEHDIYKERKKWDLQFEFYKELYNLIVKATETNNKDEELNLLHKLGSLLLRSALLFEDRDINTTHPSLLSSPLPLRNFS
ncbi:MAG: hypothetical protein IIB39_07435 [Candidatus Marinimicrobia bacterium]|nr:hypothetical protein [Candidatus Neomarinimicrobiota bacterium]